MCRFRLMAAAVLLSGLMAIPAYAGTWHQEQAGWKYEKDDGTLAADQWVMDTDGKWYYFDPGGYMERNAVTGDGFVVGADGAYIPGMWKDHDQAISPWDYQQLLGRGMDVDWSKVSRGRETYREETAAAFKNAGIDHVRIRVKDDLSQTVLNSVDQQINDCLKNGLIPVLAYQADDFKKSPNKANMDKVVSWWRTAAEHYQDKSHLLAFDIMIESSDALNRQPEALNEMYEQTVSAVRQTNPDRIIMISPRLRSDPTYLDELRIPSAANGYLMAEWHFYASGPSKTNEKKLWTTGTEAEKNLVLQKIERAVAWQEKTGIPTWVGAWMAGNYNDGDDYTMEEQLTFAEFMCDSLDGAGIPFAVNSDTKFYDRENGQWIAQMEPLRRLIYE